MINMNNFVILPILVPLLAAVLLIFMNRHVMLMRIFSTAASCVSIVISAALVQTVFTHGIQTLTLGGWKAPYGIVLAADQLAALLVLTTAIIGLLVTLCSFRSIGEKRERAFYYSGVQFLLAGVSGAFLTGDLFNMYVFFELLLIASYMLIVLGGTKIQLRESLKYIVFNIVSSAFFVIGVGYLYAVTGTLNMADLSVKISESGQTGLITVIGVLLLVVFGLKGGIFPLYFWMPGSYYAPPAAISALFGSLLTKVGLYAILRVFTLIFIHDTGFTHQLMMWLAMLTVLFGVIGSIAFSDVMKIVIYLIHDMLIKGALFMLAGTLIALTGTASLHKMGGLITRYPVLGWLFFISAISLAGIPPFSGFVGKLKIAEGGFDKGETLFSVLILVSSLLVLYSVLKVFTTAFWGEEKEIPGAGGRSAKGLLYPAAAFLLLSLLFGLGTEWVSPYVNQTAENLLNPEKYIEAVLKE